jgi:hypothetical protein
LGIGPNPQSPLIKLKATQVSTFIQKIPSIILNHINF